MTDYTPILAASIHREAQVKEVRRLAAEAARRAAKAELTVFPRNMPAELRAAIEHAQQALAILEEIGECDAD